MDAIALKLCDIQGRLFELSARKGYDSAVFVKAFMRSQTAKALDSTYNRMQWAGEEYLIVPFHGFDRCLPVNLGAALPGVIMPVAIKVAHPVENVRRKYFSLGGKRRFRSDFFQQMFHTMDPVLAIEDLKEIHQQK